MKSDQPKIQPLHLDVRVRERLLASGTLDAQALHAHLAELPDLEAYTESSLIEQPALAVRESE